MARNRDAPEIFAAPKRAIPNARDAVRDRDARDAREAREVVAADKKRISGYMGNTPRHIKRTGDPHTHTLSLHIKPGIRQNKQQNGSSDQSVSHSFGGIGRRNMPPGIFPEQNHKEKQAVNSLNRQNKPKQKLFPMTILIRENNCCNKSTTQDQNEFIPSH